jgi:hypothetical protein
MNRVATLLDLYLTVQNGMSLILKMKTSGEEWDRDWPLNLRNLLIINKLAERVGFERTNERTLKTLGGTGGTVSH